MFTVMEHANRFFLEVAVFGGINVHEFLRIPVNEWEPGTLHLYHQPVTLLESVGHIGDGKLYGFYFIGREWHGFLEAFTEAAAHNLAVDEHLIAAHRIACGHFAAR